jgi:hypothetical protein
VPILVGFVVLAGACGSGPSTMVAPRATAAPTTTVFRQPGDPTYEICSEGAITKIDGQLTAGRVVGTTVTLKGPIVLTVDVSKVPSGNDRVQVAQSLSFQVLTTFNG